MTRVGPRKGHTNRRFPRPSRRLLTRRARRASTGEHGAAGGDPAGRSAATRARARSVVVGDEVALVAHLLVVGDAALQDLAQAADGGGELLAPAGGVGLGERPRLARVGLEVEELLVPRPRG